MTCEKIDLWLGHDMQRGKVERDCAKIYYLLNFYAREGHAGPWEGP